MRRRRNHRGASVLLGGLLASAVVHLLVGPPVFRLVEAFLNAGGHGGPPVRVVQLSAEQWSQNLRTRPRRPDPSALPPRAAAPPLARAPADDKPPEADKPKPERPSGQIVEVPPTADSSPNPEAKYLSKYNSHADKESVARMEERDPRLKRVTNKLQTTGEAAAPPEPRAAESRALSLRGDGADQDRAGREAQERFVLKVPDILRRDAVQLDKSGNTGPGVSNRSASEAVQGNSDHLEIGRGAGDHDDAGEAAGTKGTKDGNSTRELPMLSALMPNLGTLARISGSPSMDHVEGVPEGDGTFLNTKEFKYATFFYRVRDSVYEHWVDAALREYRRRDPTGNIYGVRDRATVLSVELGREGELDDVRVEKASGVDFLDMVAIEAFRRAQPFPNPPVGIMDEDGRIRFNFQFVVTVGSRSGINLFQRY